MRLTRAIARRLGSQWAFLAMVIGGMLFVAVLILAITGGSIWLLAARENAPWNVSLPTVVEARLVAQQ